MAIVRIVLTGTSSLLMHNIRLANPDDVWSKRIAAITKKRKKTEEDRQEIARLEFLGSLYHDADTIVMPSANILKCILNAAKITKEGKNISRALLIKDRTAPLLFQAAGLPPLDDKSPEAIEARSPKGLVNRTDFRDTTLVKIQRNMVVRTRPIFHQWGIGVDYELLTNVIDVESLTKIVQLAGQAEGLGDNRVNGMGRFFAEVEDLSKPREAVANKRAA